MTVHLGIAGTCICTDCADACYSSHHAHQHDNCSCLNAHNCTHLVYALSEMYTKSRTSGAQISSYLEAISMAVTPTCDKDNQTTGQQSITAATEGANRYAQDAAVDHTSLPYRNIYCDCTAQNVYMLHQSGERPIAEPLTSCRRLRVTFLASRKRSMRLVVRYRVSGISCTARETQEENNNCECRVRKLLGHSPITICMVRQEYAAAHVSQT